MKNVKVIDKNTGQEKSVKLENTALKKQEYSKTMKITLLVIVLMLVVPTIITAISYIMGS